MSRSDSAGQVTADGRDARWADHRSERRARILAAAIELIDETDGDVGVVAIAARADIPRSVVYKLFKDRGDLDEQIRRQIIDEVGTEILGSFALTGTLREIVGSAVTSYVRWVSQHPRLHRFIGAGSSAHPARGSSAMLGGKAAFARSVRELVGIGFDRLAGPAVLPRGAAENLAYGLMGMTDATVNRWLRAGRERSTRADLTRFITEGACGQIQATAALAGVVIDLDRPL